MIAAIRSVNKRSSGTRNTTGGSRAVEIREPLKELTDPFDEKKGAGSDEREWTTELKRGSDLWKSRIQSAVETNVELAAVCFSRQKPTVSNFLFWTCKKEQFSDFCDVTGAGVKEREEEEQS